jgi:hypothetical protein
MDGGRGRGRRVSSFLVGGLLGSVAGIVAAGRVPVRRSPRPRPTREGLSAFEGAPCFEEILAAEAAAAAEREADPPADDAPAAPGDGGGRW